MADPCQGSVSSVGSTAPSIQPCPLSTRCFWLSFLWQKIHILIPSLLPSAVATPFYHFPASPPACGLGRAPGAVEETLL